MPRISMIQNKLIVTDVGAPYAQLVSNRFMLSPEAKRRRREANEKMIEHERWYWMLWHGEM